jgi:thymidylate synthase
MAHPEYQYLKLQAEILKNGRSKPTRGIHGIKCLFGYQLHFDLRQGFPLLTTKKMPFKILLHELLWFVSGDSNIKYLQDHKIHYWDDFADKDLNLAQFTASSGENGQLQTARKSISCSGQLTSLKTTQTLKA